jgi:hypothetical protein
MKKEATDKVVERANDSFCLPVLRRCIRAGETKHNAMSREMVPKSLIIKLTSIVGLEGDKGELELSKNVGMKCKNALQSI